MRILATLFAIGIYLSPTPSKADDYQGAIWQAMKEVKSSDQLIENARTQKFEDGYVLPLLYCKEDDIECRQYQAGIIIDANFAYKGNYTAQTNFSDCLNTGCGLMQKQPILSCAWRTVIVASGSPLVGSSDIEKLQRCLNSANDIERATMRRQAAQLFHTIYDEPLPDEWQ